jgi:hypothetical protein
MGGAWVVYFVEGAACAKALGLVCISKLETDCGQTMKVFVCHRESDVTMQTMENDLNFSQGNT